MTDADYDTLRELARLPKVVAIGEIGFDFYWDASGRDTQREHFERQLILAREPGSAGYHPQQRGGAGDL